MSMQNFALRIIPEIAKKNQVFHILCRVLQTFSIIIIIFQMT